MYARKEISSLNALSTLRDTVFIYIKVDSISGFNYMIVFRVKRVKQAGAFERQELCQ
jgi:hypothetical protein